jgi:hypothetical protein
MMVKMMVKLYGLACDGCDAMAGDDYEQSAADARLTAKEFGWHRSKGRDFCSNCWDEGKR